MNNLSVLVRPGGRTDGSVEASSSFHRLQEASASVERDWYSVCEPYAERMILFVSIERHPMSVEQLDCPRTQYANKCPWKHLSLYKLSFHGLAFMSCRTCAAV